MNQKSQSSKSGRADSPSRLADSIEPPIFKSILLCYDDRPAAKPENVLIIKKRLIKAGFNVSEYKGTPFEEDSIYKLYGIDQETQEKVHNCIAMVVCCSRELKNNLCCKIVTRYARSRRESTSKAMPEILFTMMQGSYTTQSHPFSIDGWLKWFVKGASLPLIYVFFSAQCVNVVTVNG
jgi:hypothetical protein